MQTLAAAFITVARASRTNFIEAPWEGISVARNAGIDGEAPAIDAARQAHRAREPRLAEEGRPLQGADPVVAVDDHPLVGRAGDLLEALRQLGQRDQDRTLQPADP